MLIDMVTAGKVKFQLDDQLDDGHTESRAAPLQLKM